MNCLPCGGAVPVNPASAVTAAEREYKPAGGLPSRLWVHAELGEKPRFFAVPGKHVRSEAAPIKGFDLLQLRVSGVCVEVVAGSPGALEAEHAGDLEDIAAVHAFALASEGVACSQVACPEDSPATAWLCFALPSVAGARS